MKIFCHKKYKYVIEELYNMNNSNNLLLFLYYYENRCMCFLTFNKQLKYIN